MAFGLGWRVHGDGGTPGPGWVVRPDERLSWGRTAGLGAQHAVAILCGLRPKSGAVVAAVPGGAPDKAEECA